MARTACVSSFFFYGWLCKNAHMHLFGRIGVQGMIARSLSSKLLKVSFHHRHMVLSPHTDSECTASLSLKHKDRSRYGHGFLIYLICFD